MAEYRRNYVSGGDYFFTVVTCERRPILTTELGRACLRQAFLTEQRKRPWEILGIVLLPDHLHTVWVLPAGDSDYSLRWRKIKEDFTRRYLDGGGMEAAPSLSRLAKQERSVWQRRFWEHTCRDENDMKRCLDYIHWNPVKHGLVQYVRDYPWSSFQQFVELGEYDWNWGGENPCPGYDEPEWE